MSCWEKRKRETEIVREIGGKLECEIEGTSWGFFCVVALESKKDREPRDSKGILVIFSILNLFFNAKNHANFELV